MNCYTGTLQRRVRQREDQREIAEAAFDVLTDGHSRGFYPKQGWRGGPLGLVETRDEA
jgi:hypothetical protein